MSFAVIPLCWVCFILLATPLSCSHALEERLTAAAAAGAARITKVKDYLHMVFLTRKREVL